MSKAGLFRRLEKLERTVRARVPAVESPVPRIIAQLTAAGFTPERNESWAEVWARASGITVHELRNELMRRAYGR